MGHGTVMIALESGTQALNHLMFPTLLEGREHCYLCLGGIEIRELSSAFNQSWANLSQSSQRYSSPTTHSWSSASSGLFQVLGKARINISGRTVAIPAQNLHPGTLLSAILLQQHLGKQGLPRNTPGGEGRTTTEGRHRMNPARCGLLSDLQTKEESF